ncbi:MAG: hypothetical protein AB1489_41450 [Acidobacteriota bacterium]
MRFKIPIFRDTFGKIAAITYCAGICLHLTRIFSANFNVNDVPFAFDILITLGAGYGGIGYLIFSRQVYFTTRLAIIPYILITLYLLSSTTLHIHTLVVGNHESYRVFPLWYSYLIIFIMGLSAWYSWKLRIKKR